MKLPPPLHLYFRIIKLSTVFFLVGIENLFIVHHRCKNKQGMKWPFFDMYDIKWRKNNLQFVHIVLHRFFMAKLLWTLMILIMAMINKIVFHLVRMHHSHCPLSTYKNNSKVYTMQYHTTPDKNKKLDTE